MPKVLLYLSIGLTLLTAVGGFLTKQKIDALNENLTARRTDIKNLTEDKRRLTADLKKTTEDLTAANKTIDDQKEQIKTKEGELAAAKEEGEKTKMMLMDSEMKLADLQTKYDADEAKIANFPKGIDPDKFQAIVDASEKMKAELAESRQVQDTLKTRANGLEEKSAKLQARLDHYEKQIQRPGITGRVVAVNNGWNFVIVDVGDKRGATLNAPLIVTRGGQTVARLKITQVEPGSSIADIVPGSVSRGLGVQPGDTVIFAGRQNMQPAPADETTPSGGAPGAGAGSTTMTSPLLPQ